MMKTCSVLFDMAPEPFIQLDNVHQKFNCFRLLFDLYSRQIDARNVWGQTLWSELKPHLLLEGMERFIDEFRHLPKQCHSTTSGSALGKDMKTFYNAIPLFTDLKNNAMKEMHWQTLMEQTGKLPPQNQYAPLKQFLISKRSTFRHES